MKQTIYEVVDHSGFVIGYFPNLADATLFIEAKIMNLCFFDESPECRTLTIREQIERPVEK